MRHRRRWATVALVCALALVAEAAPAAPSSAAPRAAGAEAMSWWGYWIGKKGDTQPGTKYLRQRRAARMGTNVALVHAGNDPGELALLRKGFEAVHARQQPVGVVVMLDNVLRKPAGDDRCVYRLADYEVWHERMRILADELHRPGPDGWRPVDDIVAIAGFDEVNVFGSWCFLPEPGAPAPIPYAMQLAAEYFPEVPERGHVWKVGPGQTPPNAATLEGSTLPLGYHYAAFIGPHNPTTVPYCPREGSFPSGELPADSFAGRDAAALRDFVEAINGVRGHTRTPVVFIPYSNGIGQRPPAHAQRGVACTLETLWYQLRCDAATAPESWAGQVRGFLAWQWDREPDPGGWIGTQKSRTLQQAGKWIKRNRAAPPCTPTA